MKGYKLEFFTTNFREHNEDQSVMDWIMQTIKELKIPGATIIKASSGLGSDGGFHMVSFFESAECPVEIKTVVTKEQCDELLQRIKDESVHVFYVKTECEFQRL